MSENSDQIFEWAPLWARVQGLAASIDGSAVVIAADPALSPAQGGAEYVLPWPGSEGAGMAAAGAAGPGSRLTLVGDDAQGIADFARQNGMGELADRLLLSAPTAEIAQVASLPDEAQVASAPMDTYDVVEISLFDHPVCSGRISIGDAAAVIAGIQADSEEHREAYEPALLAALAEEAYLHGAGTLYMIAEPERAEGYGNSGWSVAARVTSFEIA
ncbi:hypothetical protein [Arthrobacter sp. 92]|uniref:hypothetical protein n=1 Tax=Arthrobacter sp. 92 TaxID=3418175 RepID=UPI003CFE1842